MGRIKFSLGDKSLIGMRVRKGIKAFKAIQVLKSLNSYQKLVGVYLKELNVKA